MTTAKMRAIKVIVEAGGDGSTHVLDIDTNPPGVVTLNTELGWLDHNNEFTPDRDRDRFGPFSNYEETDQPPYTRYTLVVPTGTPVGTWRQKWAKKKAEARIVELEAKLAEITKLLG